MFTVNTLSLMVLFKVKDLVKRAAAAGMPAVALTDRNNLFATS